MTNQCRRNSTNSKRRLILLVHVLLHLMSRFLTAVLPIRTVNIRTIYDKSLETVVSIIFDSGLRIVFGLIKCNFLICYEMCCSDNSNHIKITSAQMHIDVQLLCATFNYQQ